MRSTVRGPWSARAASRGVAWGVTRALPELLFPLARLALEAGDDGMQMLRRLLAQCPGRLRQGGQLLVEVGLEYKNTMALFEHEFPALEPIWLQTEETTDQVFMLTGDTR